jgi:DNA invertase Pin-like site-specific DNA recombinase
VVKSLDRLGRNKDATKAEIQWFKEHGVVLRILNVPTSLIEFKGQEWIADMVNNILING